MYSRYHDRPLRVPENYSGVAFSEAKTAAPEKSAPSPHRLDVARPTPPPPDERRESLPMPPPPRPMLLSEREDRSETVAHRDPTPPTATKTAREEQQERHDEVREIAALKPFRGLFGQLGHAFPFSHGIGFDELLILGLILLLSQSGEGGSDVVLWLALLLFCG